MGKRYDGWEVVVANPGKRGRRTTITRMSDGRTITFMDALPKGEAIYQAMVRWAIHDAGHAIAWDERERLRDEVRRRFDEWMKEKQ